MAHWGFLPLISLEANPKSLSHSLSDGEVPPMQGKLCMQGGHAHITAPIPLALFDSPAHHH